MNDKTIQDAALEALPPVYRALAKDGNVHRYPRRTILIAEGDPGTTLYLVLEGRVKVFSSDAAGKEFVFEVMGPGAIVGEMALDGQPRSASVETLTETTCVIVPIETIKTRLGQDPDFALNMILTMIQRSRRATDYARSMALESVYERLARMLNEQSVEEHGQRVVTGLVSQQAIADRIGASRDMVSKIFKGLTQGGYVKYEKNRIILRRPLPAGW